MATDEELVEQIRQGQREAYTELFQKHYAGIYAICLSIVKNPQDAEELAQDMFVHAYLKLGQLRDPARFLPWLKKMAHNRSRNYAQRNRDKVVTLSFADSQPASADPDEELLRQELIQAIMDAIEALPVRDRQVVRARIDGLSHAEISRRFGISYRASLSRLYRVRRKLAEHLKGLYSMFGLSKILHIKEIISGGIVAMKIGTGAKVTIGVIGVLVVGFVGFQIATQQPDQEILPSAQAIRETSARPLGIPKTSQQTSDEKNIQTQIDNTTASPDSLEERLTEEEAEELLALLDELDNQDSPEETVDPKEVPVSEEWLMRRFGMTRAEIKARIPVFAQEIRTEVTWIVSLHDEYHDVLQSMYQAGEKMIPGSEFHKWALETEEEINSSWEDVEGNRFLYIEYVLRTSDDIRDLMADDLVGNNGWLYEMQRGRPDLGVPSPPRLVLK